MHYSCRLHGLRSHTFLHFFTFIINVKSDSTHHTLLFSVSLVCKHKKMSFDSQKTRLETRLLKSVHASGTQLTFILYCKTEIETNLYKSETSEIKPRQ